MHALVAECHWAVTLGTQVANESAKLSMSGYDLHVPSIAHGFLMVWLRCMYSIESHDHHAHFGHHLSVTRQSCLRPKLPMKVHVNTMSVSWAWPIKGSLTHSYHSCFQWLLSITGAPAVLLLERRIRMTKVWAMSTMMLKWCKSDAEMMWWMQLPPNCQYLQLNVCRYSLNKILRLLAPTSVWSEPS